MYKKIEDAIIALKRREQQSKARYEELKKGLERRADEDRKIIIDNREIIGNLSSSMGSIMKSLSDTEKRISELSSSIMQAEKSISDMKSQVNARPMVVSYERAVRPRAEPPTRDYPKSAFSEAGDAPHRNGILRRISGMIKNGFSDMDIIKSLKSEGYTPKDIDNAMKAKFSNGAEGADEQINNYYLDYEDEDDEEDETEDEIGIKIDQLSHRLERVGDKLEMLEGKVKNINTDHEPINSVSRKMNDYLSSLSEMRGKIDSVEKTMRDNIEQLSRSMLALANSIESLKGQNTSRQQQYGNTGQRNFQERRLI